MNLLDDNSVAASYVKCLGLLLSALAILAFVLLTTPKSGVSSLTRYAWVSVLLLNGRELLREISTIETSLVVKSVIIGELGIVLLQCFNFLVITRLDKEALIKAKVFKGSDGLFYKAICVICLVFNLRAIGTPWRTGRFNKPPRFFHQYSDGGKPYRGVYIIRQLLIISWQYLFLDFVYISSLESTAEDTEKLFGPGKEFVYMNATVEQWAGRVSVGFLSWLAPARVVIDIAYRSSSVISVLLGLTSPEDWPPLFGRIQDSYSIRGFWNTFWHQYCRWALTSISNYVCRDVLHLPRPSMLERYLNITLVFLASGVVHVVLDAFCWHPPLQMPTIAFFVSFAVAIPIEDGVQALYRCVTGRDTRKGPVPLWHKIIGYLWVSLWLTLTSPWYLYHITRLSPELKWMVPISVLSRTGPMVGNILVFVGGLVLSFVIGGEI